MGCHINRAMSLASMSKEKGGARLATVPELAALRAHGLLHKNTVRSMLCSRALGQELLQGRVQDGALGKRLLPGGGVLGEELLKGRVVDDGVQRTVACSPPSMPGALGPDLGEEGGGGVVSAPDCLVQDPLPQQTHSPMPTWTWDPDLAPVSIARMPPALFDRVQRGLREAGGKYKSPALEAFMEERMGQFTHWYDTRDGNMQLDRDRGTGSGSSNTHSLQGIMLRQILFVSQQLRSHQALTWEVVMDPIQVAEWVSFLMAKGSKGTTVATYLERLTRFQSFVGTLSRDHRPPRDYTDSLIRWTKRVTCHFRGLKENLKTRDTILQMKQHNR